MVLQSFLPEHTQDCHEPCCWSRNIKERSRKMSRELADILWKRVHKRIDHKLYLLCLALDGIVD